MTTPTVDDAQGRQALATIALRRGDLDTLQRLADLDPALGRTMAARLVDQGHKPKVEYESECHTKQTNVDGDTTSIVSSIWWWQDQGLLPALPTPPLGVRLVAPLRVPLLWSPQVARLWACDCVEQCLGLYEHHRPGDARPRAAVDAARAFANGAPVGSDHAAHTGAWRAMCVDGPDGVPLVALAAYLLCTDKFLTAPR
ncbi:MAG: hypothetical protein KAI73_10470, partial [Rhodospirillaceae bacterium]|nr:hypothetical protein [Rhodospirillaceae bacterium]